MSSHPNSLVIAATISAFVHTALFAVPAGSASRGHAEKPPQAPSILVRLRPQMPLKGLAVETQIKTGAEKRGPAAPQNPSVPGNPGGEEGTDGGRSPAKETQPSASPESASEIANAVPSEELLKDPENGQVFSEYFQSIKARIQSIAERHQKFVVKERGKISVDFILNRKGLIVALDEHPDRLAANNPMLLSRALTILRESEPFRRFPPEIQAGSISFNITLVFDG